MTGADGTFTLSSIPGGKDAVLVFSFIGFRSQEVKVGNLSLIHIFVCHEDGVSFDAGSIKIEPITVEKKYPGTRFYFTAHLADRTRRL